MENYVYSSKHLPELKKYGFMKTIFLALGCLVLLLQSITWLIVWFKDMTISVSDMVFVGLTLISALFFIASQCFFIARNRGVMNIVKQGQTFSTMRVKARFSNKHSWAGAMVVFCKFLLVLFVMLLGILIVNFIQDYVNWGKIILKMPFMVFCALSLLHLSAELRYQKVLESLK